jgi:hypothetical protein
MPHPASASYVFPHEFRDSPLGAGGCRRRHRLRRRLAAGAGGIGERLFALGGAAWITVLGFGVLRRTTVA